MLHSASLSIRVAARVDQGQLARSCELSFNISSAEQL